MPKPQNYLRAIGLLIVVNALELALFSVPIVALYLFTGWSIWTQAALTLWAILGLFRLLSHTVGLYRMRRAVWSPELNDYVLDGKPVSYPNRAGIVEDSDR